MKLIKKILLCSTPIIGMTAIAPIVLSSCSSNYPAWKTSGLPSGMSVKGSTATIKLTDTGFWYTGLTSSSMIGDISWSLQNLGSGLGAIIDIYLNVPSGWMLDISRGTYGISLDSEILNGSYNIYWYWTNSSSTSTTRLLLTGFNS